jgi:hypothetical protein
VKRQRPRAAIPATLGGRPAAGNQAGFAALGFMSDAYDYFRAHAITAVQKARALPFGRDKSKQRVVARVYHLLAKEAAYTPNLHHLDDFRVARQLERGISRPFRPR